ncbi:helix-turn-helix transcriptional regulator [Geobacter sp.]|uniref:helix-turn-helix domain-containing protein n=1 Tax=Geobacter sp. TaxID=46610 RepID=UPI00260BE8F1|nr:helix-turn-helix transcriptional regulator [Geobacter sp.]
MDEVLQTRPLCYDAAMPADIITTREIGEAIRRRRKELGLSQEQLSEKVGVSYQQIQRYENGSSMLNVENLQRIARALSLPVTAFFETPRANVAAEPAMPYESKEEKTLLRNFRDLTAGTDKKLAITIVRRLAKK